MTAIVDDRDTAFRGGQVSYYPMAATKIYKGTMVVFSGGYVAPATQTTGVMCVGIASETVDNSDGNAGDKSIKVMRGVAKMTNDTGTAVVIGDVGKQCYALDNQTVTMDATGASVAGRVFDVDASGVWVEFSIIPRSAVVSSADMDDSLLHYTKVVIAAGAVATLHTTAVTLVPTPGAGKYIQMESAVLVHNYLTAAYNDQNLLIGLNDATVTTVTVEATNFTNATASSITTAYGGMNLISTNANAVGKNLAIKAAGDLGSTGKGDLVVYITYRIITL